MALQSGKDAIFTFDDEVIGGIHSFELLEGQVQESTIRFLNGPPASRPGFPDFGRVILNLHRDDTDEGQKKLIYSLRNRKICRMVITQSPGAQDTFNAFTILMPTRGSANQSNPTNTIRCVLRIDGHVQNNEVVTIDESVVLP